MSFCHIFSLKAAEHLTCHCPTGLPPDGSGSQGAERLGCLRWAETSIPEPRATDCVQLLLLPLCRCLRLAQRASVLSADGFPYEPGREAREGFTIPVLRSLGEFG